MQIHELTTKRPLTEAGLGDYLKAALSTDPTISAMRDNPNISLAQRAQAIGRNKQIDQVAKKAYDAWNRNYLQLVKTNGNKPLSAPEYEDELEAFVQKNLMPAYTPLAGVSNAPQIQQAIQTAAASTNNPKALADVFNQLVDLAAVARELPQGRQRARAISQAAQAVTTGGQTAAPAATTPAPQSPPEIEQLKTNVVNQITGQNKLSTKDAEGRVNALLQKGTFSPRDIQAWARSLPPGNIPSRPYPPGEYPAVNMMVNKLLGLA